jgi:hypothetical protein
LAKRIVDPKQQKPKQATNERGVPYWEVFEKETGHVVHTFLSDTAADAKVDGKNWLKSIGAEQPDLFDTRPKTNATAPVMTKAADANRAVDNAQNSARLQATLTGSIPEVPMDVAQNFPPYTFNNLFGQDRTDGRDINFGNQFSGQWRVMLDGEEVWRFRGVGNNQGDANRIAQTWLQDQRSQGLLSPAPGADIEVVPVMAESVMESANPADTLYFFDVAKGGRSFDHLDLRIMGLKKSQKGRWYYQPGRDSTDLLTTATLKYLEKTLNVPARAWTKPVDESRIIDPERVDVYYRPVPGSRGRRVVARNIPTSTLEPLLQKLSEKYAVPVESFEWTPTEPITEAFDQPYAVQWTKRNGDWHATADLDDGSELVVLFMSQGDNQWMVEFERDENMEITGEGDAPRVFATVLTAMRQFIAKRKPAMLNFSAEKEDDPTGSRARLYDRMIQRYITGTGYNLTRKDYPGGATYTLTKQVQGVAENFADGKGPGRPGDSQRHGIPKGATMAQLEKASHAKGRKGQLARWQLNMRRGRKK